MLSRQSCATSTIHDDGMVQILVTGQLTGMPGNGVRVIGGASMQLGEYGGTFQALPLTQL